MITKYVDHELFKNKITRKDADFVLRSQVSIWEDIGPSKRGLMFTGFDSNGRLLEIAVEYFDEDDIELIFHTKDATPKRRKLFERIKS